VTAARKRLGVPALGAAVLSADGTLASQVDGVRRRGRDEPATLEDQWHIGSCGKSMTAALYARLVEAGRASWSASIVELFGDLDVHQSGSGVTIEHLLLCTSGAPANIDRRRFVAYLRDERPPVDQRTEVAAELFARAPQGTGEFRYSNPSYTVAGAAIERIAGEPYESALHAHLFQPLGITTAGFGPPPALRGHGCSSSMRRGPRWRRRPSNGCSPSARAVVWRWAGPRPRASVRSFGQQGSNTNWVASALLDQDRRRAALVVVNDGRMSLFMRTARMAAELLTTD
jgi:CubicO group peptidase (beta-lactamase class C family)